MGARRNKLDTTPNKVTHIQLSLRRYWIAGLAVRQSNNPTSSKPGLVTNTHKTHDATLPTTAVTHVATPTVIGEDASTFQNKDLY